MNIWNKRTVWQWLPAICVAIGVPASARVDRGDAAEPAYVDLARIGKAEVKSSAGKHRATVVLTVARTPAGWPETMRIGPGPSDIRASRQVDRMVTQAELRVDGCVIDQPWPQIAGLAMPHAATLSFVKGQWHLDISGGGGAEDYLIAYVFDGRRVLARDMDWGPDLHESTRYDIDVDPNFGPQICEKADGLGRRSAPKAHR
jgi:hypothetical protein